MSRIVITTWGSLGDLHPYLAIALELQRRGHEAVVATSPCYREKVESLGLRFQSVRPDCDWLFDGDKVRHFSHPRWGLLRVGRELLMASVAERNPLYSERASRVGEQVRHENGVQAACDALENVLQKKRSQ